MNTLLEANMIEIEEFIDYNCVIYVVKGTKKYHREDGPAIEWDNGDKEWYINGKLHRDDGPAQVYCDTFFWYLNGIRLPTREGWFEALPEDGRLKLLYSENFIRG